MSPHGLRYSYCLVLVRACSVWLEQPSLKKISSNCRRRAEGEAEQGGSGCVELEGPQGGV